MPWRDKEWEDLQRDCAFFPAYTDLIFGPDTREEATEEPRLHSMLFPLDAPMPIRYTNSMPSRSWVKPLHTNSPASARRIMPDIRTPGDLTAGCMDRQDSGGNTPRLDLREPIAELFDEYSRSIPVADPSSTAVKLCAHPSALAHAPDHFDQSHRPLSNTKDEYSLPSFYRTPSAEPRSVQYSFPHHSNEGLTQFHQPMTVPLESAVSNIYPIMNQQEAHERTYASHQPVHSPASSKRQRIFTEHKPDDPIHFNTPLYHA
ncbi:hypothetical protein ACN47E_007307 [Coniothyrium glycines]